MVIFLGVWEVRARKLPGQAPSNTTVPPEKLRSENLTFEARHQGTTLVPGPLGATTITGRQHQTARVDGMYIYICIYIHNNNYLSIVHLKKHIMCSGYCSEYEDRRKHILDLGELFFLSFVGLKHPVPCRPCQYRHMTYPIKSIQTIPHIWGFHKWG